MRKLLILTMMAFIVAASLSSCSFYQACPTYANSSMKKHGAKYKYSHASARKKQKKTKFF